MPTAPLSYAAVLLVCCYTVVADDVQAFRARVRHALELLGDARGCRGGELGRSVDEPDRWVLTVRFDSVRAYRRALAPFPVREHVVPLLAEASTDGPATFEVLTSAADGVVGDHPTLLA